MKINVRTFLRSVLICAATGCAVLAIATTQPSPVAANSKAKARGAEVFATHGCAHCHGPAGVGGIKGPDLQLVRKRLKKGQIRHQIHDGGKSMPAYGDMLTSPQINDLIAYLRAKRKVIVVASRPPAAPPTPEQAQSDPN